MEIYLSLLVQLCLSYFVCGLKFEDGAENLGHTKQSERFFPSSDEPDKRYSEISGIKYIDPHPQNPYEDSSIDNRKQLNFNGNQSPQAVQQYYQQNSYRPTSSSANVNVIRKRPYQHASSPSNYYPSYQMDLSNPFYHNYANHYQYPSGTYPEYINPTRYPSPTSANLNGQQHQLLHQPSLHYPNYYTNNYANQYGYQRPPSFYGNGVGGGGVSNFLNNFREPNGPFGQISQVGGQFSKALEDISANDDLQCVPKILCQMVRSQRRPHSLPSFMNIPGLSAIISALPSSSPLMNFGRAALLGLSAGGECDAAYPRCPRDEEQMLYYLNNHRGGFFRFFNGGHSFGDDSLVQQQLQQHLNQQQFGGDSSSNQGLNLLALQALAESLNQGSGINLNNLFSSPSNQRPAVQSHPGLQADQSGGLGGLLGMFKPNMLSDVVSNLLTGVIGNRFSRRLSKRSISDDDYDDNKTNEDRHKIEKRIVNLKPSEVLLEQKFFEDSSTNEQQTTLYDIEEPFTFSNGKRINIPQTILDLKFPKENVHGQEIPLSEINQGNFISPSDVARRLKMLFPQADGHLRFDNDQFNRELLKALVNDRIAKILTGVQQQRPINNNNYAANRYQGYHQSSSNINSNRYPAQSQNYYAGAGSSNYNNFNNNHISKGQSSSDRRHIVYITNSRGQIEYTLNELTGEKKRV
ncbi:CLUMA_CG011281, isoform A [Clunio marinus]|uniref:CLUMA_CG011281, isoform A n=1 Tax=Clunio marinus TaxID=568069 RepID=A0A1J1IDR7_9DIPT|nr:CLUMA_CG011281, isoform A [Clunio marinus]